MTRRRGGGTSLRLRTRDHGARLRLIRQQRARIAQLEAEIARHVEADELRLRLVRELVNAQEDERARIARDLHDQLGQQVTALRLALDRHRESCADADHLSRLLALVDAIDSEVDFLAWELRPAVLDDLGLPAALPRFVRQWSDHYGIHAECHGEALPPGALSREAEVAFYRVAQEALMNVAKHARATRADVVLDVQGGSVRLVVEDNGVGFDPSDTGIATSGIGLVGMRERAALIGATLEIESRPGGGTSVFLRAPLRNRPEEGA